MKIIHVDDHTLFTEGLNAVLTRHDPGLQVISTVSAREALDILDAQRAEDDLADLLLVDLHMPELDGFAFLQAIEQRDLHIPVVIISASEDLWDIRAVMDAGATGFIPKTYKIEQIVGILDVIMAGEVFLPDDIRAGIAHLPKQKPVDIIDRLMAHYNLKSRQVEVLRLMQEGYSNDDIATIMYLSPNTIKTHVSTLHNAFGVKDRFNCVRFAEKVGLLSH